MNFGAIPYHFESNHGLFEEVFARSARRITGMRQIPLLAALFRAPANAQPAAIAPLLAAIGVR